jgi:coenzyme F420-reducing hydrogenase alpha subunit
MKFPYLRKLGFPVGSYRVGAIARLNVNDKIPTEMASNLFEQLKLQYPPPIYNLLLYHYARIIELVYAYERAIEILEDERVSKSDIRVPFKCHEGEGMAAIEDHTGTLIHHYRCDKKGIIREANIIAGTTHNNFNIEKSIEIALKKYEKIEKITPKILSDIELVLRAYDPCLVCGSH